MPASLTLTYGSLNLTASPYAVVFGSDTGAPENESIPLASFIQDGDIELSSRAGNRTIQFQVLIEGASLTAMATAEANLVAETEKAFNTLTADPGDSAPAAVYEVFRGQVSLARNDDGEVARLRTYAVTVRALPYPRSVTETVTAALPATGSTTTLLDACSATTGWTGFVDGGSVSPATAGGAVTLTASPAKGLHTYALQKTFAATTTSTKYLAVAWKPPAGKTSSAMVAIGDGVTLPLLAEIPSGTAGYVKSYFYVAASSLAVTRFEWSGVWEDTSSGVLSIDNVDVTNVNPIIGTGRQQVRSLTVAGSARAPGALAVESSTAALDDAIVYVYDSDVFTDGYNPSLRQFRSAGNTQSASASRVSGFSEPLNPAVTFTIPVSLFPRGSYHLLGRLSSASSVTTTMTVSTKTTIGGNPIGSDVRTLSIPLTTTWTTFALAKFSLPTVDLPLTSPASIEMVIGTTSTGTPAYDEFWLLNVDLGCYVRVNCGTGAGASGAAARRLFVYPPTQLMPRPRILIGHAADGSDAYYPTGAVSSWGFPQFKPPQVNVFVVTPGATDAAVSLRHFPRWHTNPAA